MPRNPKRKKIRVPKMSASRIQDRENRRSHLTSESGRVKNVTSVRHGSGGGEDRIAASCGSYGPRPPVNGR